MRGETFQNFQGLLGYFQSQRHFRLCGITNIPYGDRINIMSDDKTFHVYFKETTHKGTPSIKVVMCSKDTPDSYINTDIKTILAHGLAMAQVTQRELMVWTPPKDTNPTEYSCTLNRWGSAYIHFGNKGGTKGNKQGNAKLSYADIMATAKKQLV